MLIRHSLSVSFIMIFLNVISQILHFVNADTMKKCTISFLNVKTITTSETICLTNYLRLTQPLLIQIYFYADIHLPLQTNISIFLIVRKFIVESIRFTSVSYILLVNCYIYIFFNFLTYCISLRTREKTDYYL